MRYLVTLNWIGRYGNAYSKAAEFEGFGDANRWAMCAVARFGCDGLLGGDAWIRSLSIDRDVARYVNVHGRVIASEV